MMDKVQKHNSFNYMNWITKQTYWNQI